MVVAIWGVESNFGRFSGMRPTIAALATLAWDPRRSNVFRGELLQRARDPRIAATSSCRGMQRVVGRRDGPAAVHAVELSKFAEDFDGDGRRDIWTSPADIFASIANYLKAHGWDGGRNVGTRGESVARRRATDRERRRAPRRGRARRRAT